jgi:hypothetical protein
VFDWEIAMGEGDMLSDERKQKRRTQIFYSTSTSYYFLHVRPIWKQNQVRDKPAAISYQVQSSIAKLIEIHRPRGEKELGRRRVIA